MGNLTELKMTSINKEQIEYNGDSKARLVVKGQWSYDGSVPMPVQIFAINYDFDFEMDKTESFLRIGQQPELNEQGEQYLIAWHGDRFFSFAGSTNYGGLSVNEAKSVAEVIIGQTTEWL